MKTMRKCTLCPSHQYEYCTKCKPNSQIESWKLSFDTETCRDVYHILAEFAFGRKTALDARKELENYVIPNKEEMTSPLRKNLEEVYVQTKDIYEKEKDVSPLLEKDNKNEKKKDEAESIKPRRRRYTRRSYDN